MEIITKNPVGENSEITKKKKPKLEKKKEELPPTHNNCPLKPQKFKKIAKLGTKTKITLNNNSPLKLQKLKKIVKLGTKNKITLKNETKSPQKLTHNSPPKPPNEIEETQDSEVNSIFNQKLFKTFSSFNTCSNLLLSNSKTGILLTNANISLPSNDLYQLFFKNFK